MENWVGVVIGIALVVQVTVLTMLFIQTRQTMQQVQKSVADLNNKISPILTRVQILLDDTQPKISTMVGDAAHIVYLARGQAQKVDRVFTEAADRLRGQLVRADRILTGTLEAVEEAGSQFKHSLRSGWICCGRGVLLRGAMSRLSRKKNFSSKSQKNLTIKQNAPAKLAHFT